MEHAVVTYHTVQSLMMENFDKFVPPKFHLFSCHLCVGECTRFVNLLVKLFSLSSFSVKTFALYSILDIIVTAPIEMLLSAVHCTKTKTLVIMAKRTKLLLCHVQNKQPV